MVARGEDCLVACDCIQSVSLLQISPGPGSRLDIVARDYEPLWPLAVETCEGKGIIGASVGTLFPGPMPVEDLSF